VGGSGVSRGKKASGGGGRGKAGKANSWGERDGRYGQGELRLGSFGYAQDRLFGSVWRKFAPNYAQDDSKNRGLAGLAVEKRCKNAIKLVQNGDQSG
jgi:hypothetical protein